MGADAWVMVGWGHDAPAAAGGSLHGPLFGCTAPCRVPEQHQEAAVAAAAALLQRVSVHPVQLLLRSNRPTREGARPLQGLLLPAAEARQWRQEQQQQEEQWHLVPEEGRASSLVASNELILLLDSSAAVPSATTTAPASAVDAAAASVEAIAAELAGPVALLLHSHASHAARLSSSSGTQCCCCCMTLLAENWLPLLIGSSLQQQLLLLRAQGIHAAAANLMQQPAQQQLQQQQQHHTSSPPTSSSTLLFSSSSAAAAAREVKLSLQEAADVDRYFASLELMEIDGSAGTPPKPAPRLPYVMIHQQQVQSGNSSNSGLTVRPDSNRGSQSCSRADDKTSCAPSGKAFALPSWLRNLPDFVDRRMQSGRLGELLTFTKVLPQEVCRHFGFEISRIVEVSFLIRLLLLCFLSQESDCLWSVDRGQKSLSAAESASEQVVVEKVICFWLNGAQESGLPFDLVLRLRHTNGSEEVLYIEVKTSLLNNWEFCLSFPQLQFAASHPKNYVILVISSLRSGAPRWAAIPDVSSSIGLSRLCSPEGSNTGGAPEAADGEVGGVEVM
ncbi:uncharacterized protein LOC34624589 [Cyclospora cayetanensis]|uniref:Uncharacterized protein LOC34624589 n=1 Tax=Cyclospora cayetanensis TaxID=88456 RepID=A0A6P6S2W1_9EIME|nr:uncharacterized protein LOC34624589 [Cyclospora cayetanensis]